MSVRGFRDLRVWHSAMELAVATYGLTRELPRHETYGLVSQIQRAAVSVPANIAEGHTRHGLGEYLHFVSVARASLAEVETYLELLPRLGYVSPQQTRPVLDLAASVSRQLIALRDGLNARRHHEPTP